MNMARAAIEEFLEIGQVTKHAANLVAKLDSALGGLQPSNKQGAEYNRLFTRVRDVLSQ